MSFDLDQSFAGGALKLSRNGETAVLTLSRPNTRNALNRAVWAALPEVTVAVEADDHCKLLIVSGAGDHFAAGADIAEFETAYATRESTADYAASMARGLEALASLSKPSLACIRGSCIGAGVAFALTCDLRLAASDARFGVTPARLGLMYPLSDTRRLVQAVGPSAAKDMLFTGRLMAAAEAAALGLVDAVYPPGELGEAVTAKAEAICAVSQWSVRRAKAIVALVLDGTRDDTDQTRAWFLDAMEGEDYREGRDAFLAKRTPGFRFR